MKFKSTLWALAFACAAVSCSDELDEAGKGNGTNEELKGTKTYVKVAINAGIGTRASNGSSEGPTGGEGEGTELGLKDEYTVKDVTLILFDNKDNNDTGANKNGYDFLAGSNIRGVGYADQMLNNPNQVVPEHGWEATVQVVIDEGQASLFGNTYGVIAVTNLGKGTDDAKNDLYQRIMGTASGKTKIATGKQLADYITGYKTDNVGFIMSTHAMKWPLTTGGTDVESTVTIEEGIDENNAPTVHAFVERLAAKIRIKDYVNDQDAKTKNFLYTLTDGATTSPTTLAKVRLDNVAIVNQLTSGAYLLKRVSAENPDFSTTVAESYLGDEVWNSTTEKYNYVMDPWITTRTATATLPTASDEIPALTYGNSFGGVADQDYATMWNSYANDKGTTVLANAAEADYNDNGGIRLAYTMENVTQATHSLNGYSTGALFKATYFPDKLTAVKTSGTGANIETEAVFVDYAAATTKAANSSTLNNVTKETTGVSFYEYKGSLYASQEAIFIDIINSSLTQENLKTYNYGNFREDKFSTMTIANYQTYFDHISDPFGYIDDLNKKIDEYLKKDENKDADLTTTQMSALGQDAKTFTAFMTDKADETFGDAKYYADGVCYYPYWIRHANNNKASVMGVMEFAIVRNNIYDLAVAGMKTWGFSGTDVPDPTDPDEDGTARINVRLYVRNWVVRSNGDIIL